MARSTVKQQLFILAALLAGLVSCQQANVNICENVSDYVFITDISNCSQYFICVGGYPVQQACNPGYSFDGETQSCVAAVSQCLQCNSSLIVYPLYKTCNKYVMCYDNNPIVQRCADNLQFNQNTNKCDLPVNVDCVANDCPVLNNVNNITYTRSYAACDKYYVCMTGTQYPETCAPGLQFDTSINRCNYASLVGCKITSQKRSTTSEANDDMLAPQSATGYVCPAEGIHYFSHSDADKYYVCTDGVGSILTCARSLVYDDRMHECRLPKMRGL